MCMVLMSTVVSSYISRWVQMGEKSMVSGWLKVACDGVGSATIEKKEEGFCVTA